MTAPDRRARLAWLAQVVSAVARRPRLWPTAVAQVFRLAPPGWWRRPPFLPVPDPAYLRFRLTTAYADPDVLPAVTDVVTYLEWCRAWPRLARRPGAHDPFADNGSPG